MNNTMGQDKRFNYSLLLIPLFVVIGVVVALFLSINNTDKKEYKLSIDQKEVSMYVNGTYQIELDAEENEKYEYKSSDESVARVDENGIITGVSTGKAVITVTSSKGDVAEIEVTIEVNDNKPTSITVTKNLTLKVRESSKLNVELLPAGVSDNITYTSSDTSIMSVDNNGVIKANKAGTATITVSTSNGLTDIATITVLNENEIPKEVKVESVSFKINGIKLKVGDKSTLEVIVLPENATNKTIIWKSNDENIVKVNNGIITGVKVGEATITATVDGKSANLKVYVKDNIIPVTGLTLDKTSITMNPKTDIILHATISPNNASNKELIWSSNNSSVASVDKNGKVTAKSSGTAIITVKTVDGKFSKTATVKVNSIKASSVTLSPTSTSIDVGGTTKITATINPSEASNNNITWGSSDTSIATVNSNGVVTGKKAGTVDIVASCDGKTATAKVTVKNVEATSIKITGSKNIFYTNYTNSSSLNVTLSTTFTPSNTTNKTVTWSSSDTSIATVNSSGVVTAKKKIGKAVITATTSNGKKATYTITVRKRILVVITASQGMRMEKYVNDYTNSAEKMYFSKTDKTLYFIARSGSGVCFQTAIKSLSGLTSMGGMDCVSSDNKATNTTVSAANDSGMVAIKKILDADYSSSKDYVEPYIIYTMPGNSLKKLSCDDMTVSRYTTLAKAYNAAANYLKETNKYTNTKAFMVSHFPVNAKMAKAYYDANNIASSSRKVVASTNANKCKSGYSSAWKYYHSGETFKTALTKTSSTIKYVDVFADYSIPKDMSVGSMQWNPKQPYDFTITDDKHMDETTAKTYTKYMFDKVISTK